MHLAHPLGVKALRLTPVPEDFRHARDLADLLQMDGLTKAWIAPLAGAGTARDHPVPAEAGRAAGPAARTRCTRCWPSSGIPVTCTDLFGTWGTTWLDGLQESQPYAGKVCSLRQLIGALDAEITMLTPGHGGPAGRVPRLPGHPAAPRHRPGAGGGDRGRDRRRDPVQDRGPAGQLGRADPPQRESDVKVVRGHVGEPGSRLLRWALIEAVQRDPSGEPGPRGQGRHRRPPRRIQARNIAKVAAARQLLTLVFSGLVGGQIRSLSEPAGAAWGARASNRALVAVFCPPPAGGADVRPDWPRPENTRTWGS